MLCEEAGFEICIDHIPKQWTNYRAKGSVRIAFDQMYYQPLQTHVFFNELLSRTYRPVATQDRVCPNQMCSKTPGGCPCVQVGGVPGFPTEFRTLQVIRVEDSRLWNSFVSKRRSIKEARQEDPVLRPNPIVQTVKFVNEHPKLFDGSDADVNEVYLWHGTKIRAALNIAQDHFNISFAGSNVGTMYGRGIYLCEHCTKADEYAQDETNGYYDGVYALILCRVVLGKYFYTNDRNIGAEDEVKSGRYDSTLGDRLTKAKTFREFVVYDADQVYPEFIVLYSRVHAGDDPSLDKWQNTSFHMQLPIYWRNCHVNPQIKSFNEHYQLSKFTQEQMLRLLQSCFKNHNLKYLTIINARRVENSDIWNNYVNFKVRLRDQLRSTGVAAVMNLSELQGSQDSALTLTDEHLKSEDQIGVVHMDYIEDSLGEHYFLHGTSEAATEAIVQRDFDVNISAKHGKRFGNGVYFAELIDKSLDYAEKTARNTQFLLLCRVCLGQSLYVSDSSKTDAHTYAKSSGKHSVIANPNSEGPCEFIAHSAEQVYPEYIIEIQVLDKPSSDLSVGSV